MGGGGRETQWEVGRKTRVMWLFNNTRNNVCSFITAEQDCIWNLVSVSFLESPEGLFLELWLGDTAQIQSLQC